MASFKNWQYILMFWSSEDFHIIPFVSDYREKQMLYNVNTMFRILKDTAECPNDDKHIKQLERERLARMPSMNYSEIFHTILSLYDIVPFIAIGQKEMARALIGVTNCLLCFLNRDLLDCIPYTVICVLPLWPVPLQKDLLNMICFSLLPMILGQLNVLL